jgi:hypothetical protein
MSLYDRKGIFSNAADTVEDLHATLREHFIRARVEVNGAVALFRLAPIDGSRSAHAAD